MDEPHRDGRNAAAGDGGAAQGLRCSRRHSQRLGERLPPETLSSLETKARMKPATVTDPLSWERCRVRDQQCDHGRRWC